MIPKIGNVTSLRKLQGSLLARGAKDPGALAAYIGRKRAESRPVQVVKKSTDAKG